jgi:porphobilinogen synthase
MREAGHAGAGAVPGDRSGLKTPDGIEATNPMAWCRAWRALKPLSRAGRPDRRGADPTSHGQDGVIDETATSSTTKPSMLVRQALTQAEAGVDVVALGHDGRPHRRHPRRAGSQGHIHTRIMAYSAKYASASTARSAMRWARPPTWARATSHLPDGPGQQRRGLREVALDLGKAPTW